MSTVSDSKRLMSGKGRIYVTHCCAKKRARLKRSQRAVSPEELYVATPTRRFIRRCQEQGVRWAIFSDLYGVWFPQMRRPWYERAPDSVTPREFARLLRDFDRSLRGFREICFYHNPGRFHPIYRALLQQTKLRKRVRLFTHLSQIG